MTKKDSPRPSKEGSTSRTWIDRSTDDLDMSNRPKFGLHQDRIPLVTQTIVSACRRTCRGAFRRTRITAPWRTRSTCSRLDGEDARSTCRPCTAGLPAAAGASSSRPSRSGAPAAPRSRPWAASSTPSPRPGPGRRPSLPPSFRMLGRPPGGPPTRRPRPSPWNVPALEARSPDARARPGQPSRRLRSRLGLGVTVPAKY